MHKKAQETVKSQIQEKIATLCANECNSVSSCENAVSSIHVVDGYPAQVILNVAKEFSADLIIMGAYNHTLVGEVIVGSTTRKVLHQANLPVLVVKIPKDFQEE
jgi:nucleotide-binding universal stress UspA family protein